MCPVNLAEVFTMQYSTEKLQVVLEWIIEHLGKIDSKLEAKIPQIIQ